MDRRPIRVLIEEKKNTRFVWMWPKINFVGLFHLKLKFFELSPERLYSDTHGCHLEPQAGDFPWLL